MDQFVNTVPSLVTEAFRPNTKQNLSKLSILAANLQIICGQLWFISVHAWTATNWVTFFVTFTFFLKAYIAVCFKMSGEGEEPSFWHIYLFIEDAIK